MTSIEIPVSIAAALPNLTVLDITNDVKREVANAGGSGIAYVSPNGDPSCVRVQERETGFFSDLECMLERLVPAEASERPRLVSFLMGPNGIGAWSQSYATPGIPTAPGVQSGKGSYVTIWNNPNPGNAGHVWIEILGQYFESSGSGGVHQMDQGEVNMYLKSGQYQPFHPAGM